MHTLLPIYQLFPWFVKKAFVCFYPAIINGLTWDTFLLGTVGKASIFGTPHTGGEVWRCFVEWHAADNDVRHVSSITLDVYFYCKDLVLLLSFLFFLGVFYEAICSDDFLCKRNSPLMYDNVIRSKMWQVLRAFPPRKSFISFWVFLEPENVIDLRYCHFLWHVKRSTL